MAQSSSVKFSIPKLYLRAFREFGAAYKNRIAVLVIISIIIGLIALVNPYFTKILIDCVVTTKDSSLLNRILLGMIIVVVLSSSIGLLRTYLGSVLQHRINFDVRLKFFEHLQTLSIQFYGQHKVGDLMYRMFSDAQVMCASLANTPISLIINVMQTVIVVVWMLFLNAGMSLFVFSAFIIHIGLIFAFQNPIRKLNLKMREQHAGIYSSTKEKLDGMQLVQSSGTERTELQDMHTKSFHLLKVSIRLSLINGLSGVSTSTIATIWSFGVLWYGGQNVILGNLTIGELMAFMVLCNMLFPVTTAITNLIIGFPATMVSLYRFYEVRDSLQAIHETKDALPFKIGRGEISFRGVSFKYPDSPGYLLKDLSLDIAANEKVALVGPSGAGKTTLVNLLSRFLNPEKGIITIDGHDITAIKTTSLRESLGFVLQNFFVFSGTILDNIRYGNPEASLEKVTEAAMAAHIHDMIVTLPKGYETEIGERGQRLSSGEAQRIALARAFLKNPRVLILDEATSYLDMQTEMQIQEAIANVSGGRTTIIIAHRLTTAKQADRILFLKDGIIAESASHDELIKQNGLYSKYWKLMLAA
jgi:ABC-type multidrug transport system fused ATPase/permease subunit